ncbi:MAG: acetyl-CoA carboxylase biotin carboxyl carrier protein subunit [bacterium]|nr:acetyl-CoA carboxylase biotin carboxyl carrier protein subunit [bacterium]
MHYTAILNDKERDIVIEPLTGNRFSLTIDGKSFEADALQCVGGVLSLIVDNHSYDISFNCNGTDVLLNSRNRQFDIEILDQRKQRMRNLSNSLEHSGPEIIKTSMPGKVIKVLAQEGQHVNANTGIIIIEAMKMENELKCRKPGIVKSIHVQPGENIESDITLAVIDPLEE